MRLAFLLQGLAASSLAAQLPFSTQSTTLVDALSADKDYESVLILLQRARLIPTLNKLEGSTFFAPTNDAIKRYPSPLWSAILNDDQFVVTDNIHEELRQQLLYHLLNESFTGQADQGQSPQIHKTLHYPQKPLDPPIHDPPPHPPWLPLPSGTLGGEPQKLRTVVRDHKGQVGVDAFGKGGVNIVKDMVGTDNGVLFGISDVLQPPPALATIISTQQSLSYFRRIATPEALNFLNNTPELTLFLPIDQAWDSLNTYNKIYFESPFAADDFKRIVNMHAVLKKGVGWSDTFEPELNLTTIEGTEVNIVVTPEKTTVSGGNLVQPDIYASNGVLHLVSSLLISEDVLKITPEKYLLAFNCTTFVSMLRSVNLTDLVQDTENKYTILAPKDDVLDIFGDHDLPEKGSPELKKVLQYHFIPGHWTTKKLRDGMLLETALEEDGLKGGRQVLVADVNGSEKKAAKSIQFAGVSVIGEPVEMENIVVYFVSRPLVPPTDPISTALPSLELSAFLAAVLSTSESEVLKTTPRTSLLLPYNSAFKRLGTLVSAHLLSSSSKSDLEKVLLHHTLSDVEYASNLVNGSQQTFGTLEGSDIKLERTSNGTVLINPSGGWPGMKSRLIPKNTLTQTGVIHELSDILLPRSVDITIGKLVKAAKGSTMASIVNRAGFEWILNGTAPPEDSPWTDAVGWTLLCPTDDAFKQFNLTKLFADPEGLRAIVMQHLIPSPFANFDNGGDGGKKPGEIDDLYNNQPLPLEDTASYSTLRSSNSAYGDIVFRYSGDGEDNEKTFIIGIKDARGTDAKSDWARVVGWGRATTSRSSPSTPEAFVGGAAGGVIQIDRLILPYEPSWWIAYGAPAFVGSFGIVAICAFFYGVSIVWGWDTTEPTYEPAGGFGREDDED